MNIKAILKEMEEAYPIDIFPELTDGEREDVIERYPGYIERISAAMGRHLVQVIRRRLATCDECGQENVTGRVCPNCGARAE